MTQDIYSEKHYAGLLIRFAACVIDIILITSIAMITGVIFAGTILAVVPVILFFMFIFIAPVIFESSVYQGTPGKQLLELKVIDKDGKRISFKNAVARNIGKLMTFFIPFLYGTVFMPIMVLLLIPVLSIMLTKKKKCLHDFIGGTYVVHKKWKSRELNALMKSRELNALMESRELKLT